MRPQPIRSPCLLLASFFWTASLPAASVESRSPDGRVQVQQAAAQRQGVDPVGQGIERQFQVSYYYALAQLATQRGFNAEADALLQRAQGLDPDSALLARERGSLLEALDHDDQAALQYQQALQAQPDDLELRRSLARVYTRLDKPELARSLFLQADGSDPSDPGRLRSLIGLDVLVEDLPSAEKRLHALLAMGHDLDDQELLAALLQRQHRNDEAAAIYRQVLAAEPARTASWARLASCLDAQGDTAAALSALDQGLQAVPDSGLLADQLGKLCYRNGLYEQSEAAFGRLVDADASDADSLLFRGLSRLKLRRYAEAEADFEALGKLRSDSPGQRYALALALILQKKYGPAETALKKTLELNPQAEPAWEQLALLYQHQGPRSQVVSTLQAAVKALPHSDDLSLLLAAAYDEQGDPKAALKALERSVGQGAGEAVRFQWAVSLDQAGDFKQSESVLLALIADQPKHARALNYLGYSWADRKERLPEAEALIRRALVLEPDNDYFLDSLGWALYREARLPEAEQVLEQAAGGLGKSRDAEDAIVFDHLAQVRQARHDDAGADQARARAQAIRDAAAKAGPDSGEGAEP